jgi:predicted ATPase
VEGFTSIHSASLALRDVNVLVGANGAGKSNLIQALDVLGRIVDGELAAPDRVRLRWQQEGSDTALPADALSDGTLRFICLAALLGQPELPGLVILLGGRPQAEYG